ncbi:MAG: sulfatase [Paracoccus sp. (in: a-proteobacteria)]|nr:sulfatase [Paracoccus sp. (in: a-proteobacteria)]
MTLRVVLPLAVAALLIWLALILPSRPGNAPLDWARLTPELPLILLALSLGGKVMRPVTWAVLVALATHKLADLATFSALARGFNLRADLPLIEASSRLLHGTFGWSGVIAAIAAVVLALVAIAWGLWWAAGVWARCSLGGVPGLMLVGIAILSATLIWSGHMRADAAQYTWGRAELFQRTQSELRDFRAAASRDPFRDAQGLFGRIDRDVLVIWIESYGRTSFDTPFYAETHLPTLWRAQARLGAAGLATRSGFLEAPTRGGQSWLSHASFAQGQWIADQTRYRAALVSGRQGVFHHAARAGLHTAAVMPAITLPWPEASRMGFETVLEAAHLGYRGLPFNWVTMPDQFTMVALDRLLRRPGRDRHLFAQIALISSHAPWVPVPRLLDWDEIGDGSEFDAMATEGDPPEVVWRDRDRVRDQYRLAVDYSLHVVFDYALRHAAEPPLMIVIGDHQAAPRIALDERPDVAIHIIGPEHLVRQTADWGLSPGLVPPEDAPVLPMNVMRDLMLETFRTPTDERPPA